MTSDNVFKNAKKLGFGAMRLPFSDEGKQETAEMFDLFLERGFTYFDTAYVYAAGKSENVLKELLVGRHDRSEFTVADKLPLWIVESEGISKEEIFNTSLERTGLDYFDYYLLHSLDNESFRLCDKYDAWNFVSKLKAEGKIKNMGFSFHGSPDTLETILTEHPEVDFVQLQINYLDWESNNVCSRKCYEIARAHNKPIIVMEPVKGGSLAVLQPEMRAMLAQLDPNATPSSFAIRFAASLEGVEMVLSGMSDMPQTADNVGYMENFVPLTDKETQVLLKIADMLRAIPTIPCTGCDYCAEGCPQNIPISNVIGKYNEYITFNQLGKLKGNINWVCKDKGLPSDCIGCGACEGVCPQHLGIIEHLKTVSDTIK